MNSTGKAAGTLSVGAGGGAEPRSRQSVEPRPALLDRRCGQAAVRGLIILVVLLAWQLSPDSTTMWISRPLDIVEVLWGWIVDGSLGQHLAITLTAMLTGFVIGSMLGVAVGIFLGLTPFVERVLSPMIIGLYSIPKIAIAPLLVILFGIGIESKIVLVAITVFFMMMFSALDGIRDVDRDLLGTLHQMGASRGEVIRKVLLPGSLAWIFAGLRLSIRLAFTAAILGEIISSNRGIGYLIEHSAVTYDSTGVFAAIAIVVFFSLMITWLVSHVETLTSRWRMDSAQTRAN